MLGRKTFTQREIDDAEAALDAQLAAYKRLDGDARAEFEPLFFNHLALALDRRFVHRLRMTTGKAATPLNELELVAESLMNNHGVFRDNSVIRVNGAVTVLQLAPGDTIALREADFERLSAGVFAELREKFLEA
jgi:hypothetical protein